MSVGHESCPSSSLGHEDRQRTYRARDPEHSVLYRVLAGHLETFLARQQQDGRYVPQFVEKC